MTALSKAISALVDEYSGRQWPQSIDPKDALEQTDNEAALEWAQAEFATATYAAEPLTNALLDLTDGEAHDLIEAILSGDPARAADVMRIEAEVLRKAAAAHVMNEAEVELERLAAWHDGAA